jgi:hypothetical protein
MTDSEPLASPRTTAAVVARLYRALPWQPHPLHTRPQPCAPARRRLLLLLVLVLVLLLLLLVLLSPLRGLTC